MSSITTLQETPGGAGENRDWAGDRLLIDRHEIVQFRNNSTVRIWRNREDVNFDPHWHSALEIIMPMENYYDAEVNETSYRVFPEEFLIIPPGEVHKLIAPEYGWRYVLLFDISLIMKLKGSSAVQTILLQPLHVSKSQFPKIYNDVYQILQQIAEEYLSGDEYTELTIYSSLLNFFVKFARNRICEEDLFPNVRPSRQKEYVKLFSGLLDYIDSHYAEDLNLENMAERIGFSKFHFSRLFKQYTSLTFNDYLNYRRMRAAEELLANPNIPIIEVSMRSGYSNISTFNRLFKQVKHCTPSEYKTQKTTIF